MQRSEHLLGRKVSCVQAFLRCSLCHIIRSWACRRVLQAAHQACGQEPLLILVDPTVGSEGANAACDDGSIAEGGRPEQMHFCGDGPHNGRACSCTLISGRAAVGQGVRGVTDLLHLLEDVFCRCWHRTATDKKQVRRMGGPMALKRSDN